MQIFDTGRKAVKRDELWWKPHGVVASAKGTTVVGSSTQIGRHRGHAKPSKRDSVMFYLCATRVAHQKKPKGTREYVQFLFCVEHARGVHLE